MKQRMKYHTPMFAALVATILALAGFAHAGAVGTSRVQKAPKSAKGTLNITEATDVGGVTLPPGEYEVKQVNSRGEPVVRFTRYSFKPWVPEGLSEYDWETIAEVTVNMKPLPNPAERSELLVAEDGGKALGLQIRGSSFEYLF
jgi:hypothetical protein